MTQPAPNVFRRFEYRVRSAENGGWIVSSLDEAFREERVLGAFSNSHDLLEFLRREHERSDRMGWDALNEKGGDI